MAKSIREKIDALILSDIHLGDGTLRCDELIKLLRRYDPKKIILNGDILNGLKFQRLHTAHWKILSTLRQLSKTRDVVWVHGNHDADGVIISNLLGIKSVNKYFWEADNKKFLAIHGHQFDQFLHKNFITSQIIFATYNQLKKNSFGRFMLEYLKNNNQTWKRNSIGVAKGAMRLARVMNADYIFCGHTHQILEQEKNKIKYFNTGAWTESPSAYITINKGEAQLHTI